MFEKISEILAAESEELDKLASLVSPDDANFFKGADFSGADLRGTDLSEFDLTGATFGDASTDKFTVFNANLDVSFADFSPLLKEKIYPLLQVIETSCGDYSFNKVRLGQVRPSRLLISSLGQETAANIYDLSFDFSLEMSKTLQVVSGAARSLLIKRNRPFEPTIGKIVQIENLLLSIIQCCSLFISKTRAVAAELNLGKPSLLEVEINKIFVPVGLPGFAGHRVVEDIFQRFGKMAYDVSIVLDELPFSISGRGHETRLNKLADGKFDLFLNGRRVSTWLT